ncbi:Pfdn6 [Symbiodinium natans]|uniref:Pfdn6 protein n=1 Tax=Symbiodinium natans TaxID=878477 RepID=A0A812K660_9DINO|nr:Pfdn6 [Symbiodinium natans]
MNLDILISEAGLAICLAIASNSAARVPGLALMQVTTSFAMSMIFHSPVCRILSRGWKEPDCNAIYVKGLSGLHYDAIFSPLGRAWKGRSAVDEDSGEVFAAKARSQAAEADGNFCPWQRSLRALEPLICVLGVGQSATTHVAFGQEPANFLGLAYLLWFVGLVAFGAMTSYVSAGWDALRSNAAMWRSVLLISNVIVLALFYCQVMDSQNHDSFFGLQRSTQTVMEVTWAHMVVGVLAAIQTQALSLKVQIPAMYVNSNSALALFLWIGGIFIATRRAQGIQSVGLGYEMGVMLNMVMIQPFTVDSCCILVLCLGIVAVEQFNGSLRMRNWLLTATAFTCALILLARYLLLIPYVQEWIGGPHSPLPKEQFPAVWKGLALDDTRLEVRVKLGYVATLVPLSSGLRRVFRFGSEASLIGARSQVLLQRKKVLMTALLEAARWSTVVLIFTCYFIMPRHNATSHLQLAVLILLLLSGRGWDYAGGFISLTSSVLLLVQYIYTFKLITFPNQACHEGLRGRDGIAADWHRAANGETSSTVASSARRSFLHDSLQKRAVGLLSNDSKQANESGIVWPTRLPLQRLIKRLECFKRLIASASSAGWLVFGLIAMRIAFRCFVKESPRITKEESSQLAMVVVCTGTTCMWLFWAFVYMHQMVPLIYPVRTPGE